MARRHLRVQCRARSKRSGQQCRRFCAPGHVVCNIHGAKAPQTRRRAEASVSESKAAKAIDFSKLKPVTNPWEVLTDLLAAASAIEKRLRPRIDDTATPADVDAWIRAAERTARIAKDLKGIDPEGMRVAITTRHQHQVADAWKRTINELFAALREALPPSTHHLLAPVEEQYPDIVSRILGGSGGDKP